MAVALPPPDAVSARSSGTVSRRPRVPTPGATPPPSSPPDQQRPLAHAGDPEAPRRLVEGEAATRRRRPSSSTPSPSRARWTSTRSAPRVLGGVRQRLLGDPVDDELHVRRQPGEVAARPRSVASTCRGGRARSTWPASAAFRPRSSSAVGRSWRASMRSSSIAWLASAFVSASSCASSTGALTRAASRRRSSAVSDWLTSSWRSRATRARSSSWAASAALEVRRRSASRRSSIRRKRGSSRSTSSGPPAVRRGEAGWRPGGTGRRAPSRRPASRAARKRRWSMITLTRIVSATARPGSAPARWPATFKLDSATR